MEYKEWFLYVVVLQIAYVACVNADCSLNEFKCDDGQCIKLEKKCNAFYDCDDASDEEHCPGSINIENCVMPGWFKCNSGKCISSLFHCDGHPDCEAFEDEQDCAHEKKEPSEVQCFGEEFACLDKKSCVNPYWVCDSTPDCLDGSDETVKCKDLVNCTGGFRCANEHCIIKEFECDGDNDCMDNSDEEHCEHKFVHPDNCETTHGYFLCHDEIACIEESYLCDNFTHCFDGSDEANCGKESMCLNKNCSHSCQIAPGGAVCTCPTGYQLDSTRLNCIDDDECLTFGSCNQKCLNTLGSYQCSCDIGYHLDADGHTCKVSGGKDPLILFTTSSEIRGQYLRSGAAVSIAKNLLQVSCVAHNGHHVFWANIDTGGESIEQSNEDGTERKIIVDSGLMLPEDMEVDYITGNIYFTDSGLKHIGVCTSDGLHCAVLINKDIHKPRAIALLPRLGLMFWSDWGKVPMIAKSHMDGSMPAELITKNIHWPNGLAVDLSNDRLYWVDAKLHTISTARLDGTDRREILKNVVRHPFAIAVFEDSLYFSDWERREVLKCNKFNGKNLTSIFKEEDQLVFGLNIHHPSLYPKADNPCRTAPCEGICLLKPGSSYACACSEDQQLENDQRSCRKSKNSHEIAVLANRHLQLISRQTLGRHKIEQVELREVEEISAAAYNSLTHKLILADSNDRIIYEYNFETRHMRPLLYGVGKIMSMSFDNYTNNLYVCDEERQLLDVWSLNTFKRMTIAQYVSGHRPVAVAAVPDQRILFVAVKWPDDEVHIKQISIDGSDDLKTRITIGIMGVPVFLSYDVISSRLYWTNPFFKTIESAYVNGTHRTTTAFPTGTLTGMFAFNETVFWTTANTPKLYYFSELLNEHFVALESDSRHSPLLVGMNKISNSYRPCQYESNGGCSHICLAGKTSDLWTCTCPKDLMLGHDGRTCFSHVECDSGKFKCAKDNTCIAKILRCDGSKDCSDGEDEENCETGVCRTNQFKCSNGQCIKKEKRCDFELDCSDRSDEIGCINTCEAGKFPCGSGQCISELWVCDLEEDCSDGSDEHGCTAMTCEPDRFMCKSGTCIPKVWECDNDMDCMDGSDEHENCRAACGEGYFTCKNGDCITNHLICNGMNDCGDNSDELECQRAKKATCKNDEFMCSDLNPVCVPLASKCNLTMECPKGEDETDCASCPRGAFQCSNRKCINSRWLCDGANDCGDDSDEEIHHCLNSPSLSPACDGFKCSSGNCIPEDFACNNITDCDDKSDEGQQCGTACLNHICDGKCVPLPSGGVCKCKEGFFLESDGHTCTDIDECLDELCSQICINVPGSFNCDCFEDYILKKDKISCKSKGEKMSFIIENGDEVKIISSDFHKINSVLYEPGETIYATEVDSRKSLIYWTSGTSGTLNVLKMEDGARSYISSIGRPGKMSLDWITGNLFYIDRPREIAVCHLVQRKCATVLSVEEGAIISNFVADPLAGYIFYAKAIHSGLHKPYTKLFRYDIATKNVTALATKEITWVSGMVVDYFRQVLYWSDLHQQIIEKVDYNGENRRVLLQKEVRRPESLALYEDSLYWLSKGAGEVTQCYIYGEFKGRCMSTAVHQYDAKSLIIHQIAKQPEDKNYCQNVTCDTYSLCVRTSLGPRCLCEDGKLANEHNQCIEMNFMVSEKSRSPMNVERYEKEQAMSNTSSIFLTIFLTIAVMLSMLGLYVFLQNKKNTSLILHSIHFRNPTFGMSHATGDFHPQLLTPGQHEYVNHSPTLVQHPNGELGLAAPKDNPITRRIITFQDSGNRFEDCCSDSSDHYEDIDMKANLLP